MSTKLIQKPLAAAIGAAFITTLAGAPVANASENPFSATQLSSGYMVADKAEGKCGEGKCGGSKAKGMKKEMGEGKCGAGAMGKGKEGQCGGMKMMDQNSDGKVTRAEFDASHADKFGRMDANKDGVIDNSEMNMGMGMGMGMGKGMEGKCGEGKCGGDAKNMKKSMGEGKCGGKEMGKGKEGKCGEGKCGGKK